jgi:predicted DsbA family dithiol-disulfide isomerase
MIPVDCQVWMDVISPWCYTVKHRLEQAVAESARPAEVTVHYRSYETEPGEQGQPGPSHDAHRLVALGLAQGGPPLQGAVLERLFHAHFTEGRDVSDHEQLQRLGAEAGLDERRLGAVLAGDDFDEEVAADRAEAESRGIDTVPYIIANDAHVVHGVQPVEVLSELLAHAGTPTESVR